MTTLRVSPPSIAPRRLFSPEFTPLLQLAATLLAAVYMLFVGGTFDAGLRYRVQLLNTLLAGALGLAWLAQRVLRRQRLAPTGLEWPLVLFVVSQWVALITSAQPRLSLEWVATIMAWSAALLVLCDLLQTGWPRAFVGNALLLLAALLAAQGLSEVAAWYAGWLRLGQAPPVAFRLNGMLGHANLTAAFANLLLPLVVVRAYLAPRWLGKVACGALAVGLLAVLFFTSSRAGWLAAAVGLAALFGLALLSDADRARRSNVWQRYHGLPLSLRWLLALALVAGLALAVALLANQSQHLTHSPLLTSRQDFWMVAWQMFRLNPLTGAGPDLFTWYSTRWFHAPPGWFAPHAHSLPLQILSGSGLVGLAALLLLAGGIGWQLWQRWRAALGADRLVLAGFIGSLSALAFQHLFDYLLGSAVLVFAVVVVLGLALTLDPRPARPRPFTPLALAPAILAPLAIAVFSLRGAALNDQGLTLAAANQWPEAAQAFEAAAHGDPGLALYGQHAAYAYTLAGEPVQALPLWQRAADADPYWPLLPATAALLAGDRGQLRAAAAQNGELSAILALNEGVLSEQAGDLPAARQAYARALLLRPASAEALFWQQTELRQAARMEWLARQAPDMSPVGLGRAALANGDAAAARTHFESALTQNPADLAAYSGLARAYLLNGDLDMAERTLRLGRAIPALTIEETLELRLLAGDLARARGDVAAAVQAYGEALSIIFDYTYFGPGTYGYPHRSWYVYRRHSLPSDLVPQFARADITPALDERFIWLAEQFAAKGEAETACALAGRVWREAPVSLSGAYWEANCAERGSVEMPQP